MIQEITFTSIRTIMDRLLMHPLLQDVTLESVIRYTIDFINQMGMPKLYVDKTEILDIENYKAQLPNGVISIDLVKNMDTDTCLRKSTDEFYQIPNIKRGSNSTFNTQGNIIFVSFEKGRIMVNYKGIPVDRDGLPMIPNNSTFLEALELYIKDKYFTILFDLGKITQVAFNNLQQQKCWLFARCQSEFTVPSISEMESIKNMWCQFLPQKNAFETGFKNIGDKEFIRNH